MLPFRGDTSGLIFEAILNRAPVTPVRLNPEIPAQLERIINKSLEKDRELRYQHAADLRADLKRLKRETDSSRSSVAAAEGVPRAAPTIPSSGSVPARASSGKVTAASEPEAVIPPAPTTRWKILVPAIVIAAVLTGGVLLWRSHQAPALTEKDTIVLADFANTTGEAVFDDTLKQALRVQLEQSPFLNVLSDQKVGVQLRLMGRPKD